MVYIGIIFLIILVDESLKEYIEKNIKKRQVKLICRDKIIVTKSYNEGAALRLLEEHPFLLKCISGGILIFLSFFSLAIYKHLLNDNYYMHNNFIIAKIKIKFNY